MDKHTSMSMHYSQLSLFMCITSIGKNGLKGECECQTLSLHQKINIGQNQVPTQYCKLCSVHTQLKIVRIDFMLKSALTLFQMGCLPSVFCNFLTIWLSVGRVFDINLMVVVCTHQPITVHGRDFIKMQRPG